MRKGSITVYLSLVLCVILSLIFAALNSVRISCGRAMISLAAEEGLFSLFGGYDRILYEDYGLLLIDGGYDSGSLKIGALMDETVSVMEKVISPGLSSNLFRLNMEEKAVTGYVLATDSNGEALRKQIHELMIEKLGADIVSSLYSKYAGASAATEAAESESSEERAERLKQEYEARKSEAAQEAAAQEAGEAPDGQETAGPGEAAVPENFKNPIETIFRLRQLGIFALAIPDLTKLSFGSVNRRTLLSSRKPQTGMGLLPAFKAAAVDRFLLSKYITDFFPCFTQETEDPFRYQAEYAVAGRSNDADNLKSVLTRLLIIREAMNYSHLYMDPEKQAEASAAAVIISTVLLIPQFAEMIKEILLLCWAFGESMLDLRTLLSGGKVPLLKNKLQWQLSLEDLADLSIDTSANGNQTGFDYREYLVILLMMGSSEKLVSKIGDLLEYNRRVKGSSPAFSLDTCLCSMEIQIGGRIGSQPFLLTRSFSYDTQKE